MELNKRINARLQNLWAEKKNCEFKNGNCASDNQCPQCAQVSEIQQEFIDCRNRIESLRADCLAMAGRLFCENYDTMLPSTVEVVSRWRNKIIQSSISQTIGDKNAI